MSLNKQFFDNISIELVKRKYYSAVKVDALIAAIRREALAMDEEIRSLREQLALLQSQKAEISEAVMSAQLMSSDLLQKAGAKAAEITADAQEKAGAMLADTEKQACERLEQARAEAQSIMDGARERLERAKEIHQELTGCKQRRQEYAVDKVEACFTMLRRQHQEAIDALNLKWQDFLCDLYEDESMPDISLLQESAEAESEASESSAEAQAQPPAAVPADLTDKVSAIAGELSRLEKSE